MIPRRCDDMIGVMVLATSVYLKSGLRAFAMDTTDFDYYIGRRNLQDRNPYRHEDSNNLFLHLFKLQQGDLSPLLIPVMCRENKVLEGGWCIPCGLWSVEEQKYIQCFDESGTTVYNTLERVCQWPNGHLTGLIFHNTQEYRVDNGDPWIGSDNALVWPCIRCKSEEDWNLLVTQVNHDPNCPLDFVELVHKSNRPMEREDDENDWFERPYQPDAAHHMGLDYHEWIDPQGRSHEVRDIEGPLKFFHNVNILTIQEETRVTSREEGGIDMDLREQLRELVYHEDYAETDEALTEIQDTHHWYLEPDAYPEQPYYCGGFWRDDDPDYVEILRGSRENAGRWVGRWVGR